jgi:DNA polymerase-3 subunit epsilon
MPVAEVTLEDATFVVFDTETTGLEPGHVLQLAFVVARADGTVLERYSTYVKRRFWKPGRLGAHHVHGITRGHLRTGVPVSEALDSLERACSSGIPVAHNAAFDLKFLRSESERVGRTLSLGTTLCSLKLSRSLDPARSRRHKLGNLVEHYGLSEIPNHDALADAEATASVLPHLLREKGAMRFSDLVDYCE